MHGNGKQCITIVCERKHTRAHDPPLISEPRLIAQRAQRPLRRPLGSRLAGRRRYVDGLGCELRSRRRRRARRLGHRRPLLERRDRARRVVPRPSALAAARAHAPVLDLVQMHRLALGGRHGPRLRFDVEVLKRQVRPGPASAQRPDVPRHPEGPWRQRRRGGGAVAGPCSGFETRPLRRQSRQRLGTRCSAIPGPTLGSSAWRGQALGAARRRSGRTCSVVTGAGRGLTDRRCDRATGASSSSESARGAVASSLIQEQSLAASVGS